MKVLLFDVDGTLVRAGGAGRKALDRAIYRLYGRRGVCRELSLAGKTDLRNFQEAIQAATRRAPGPGGAGAAPRQGVRWGGGGRKEIDRVHREYLRLLPAQVSGAVRDGRYRLCPGILPLLERLSREGGVLLGLGTGNVEKGARIKLEPSGLNEFFPFGGYGSDSFHRASLLKTAVRRARKLLDGRAVRAEDVFVIGDTPLDVEAGRKAGFKTVGVGTGFASWSELRDSKPDHLAKDFRRIGQWLDWLGLKKKTARRHGATAKRRG